MKWLLLAATLALAAGCSRGVVINLGDRFPAMDFLESQDPAFREGWEWLARGAPDRALKVFQTSAAPLDKKHIAFAYVFISKNKPGLAREHFEKSLSLAPGNYEAETGLAMAYEMAGDPGNAYLVYSRLVARYPEDARVRGKYLEIKSTETERHLAEAERERAEGRTERAIGLLERAAYYSPENTAIQMQIAEFHFQKKDWETALAHFLDLQSKLPDTAAVLLRLLDIYEATGQLDRALLIADRLIALQPSDPALQERRRQIKDRFLVLELPPKFKDIFFKKEVNREDLAALIGFYFRDYLEIGGAPAILTDIDSSFARDEIIKVVGAGIIRERPNHTFDRFSLPDRAAFAVALDTLIHTIEARGRRFLFTPRDRALSAGDIPPEHKYAGIIAFMLQAQLIELDPAGNFNPTAPLSPNEVVSALQKIRYATRE